MNNKTIQNDIKIVNRFTEVFCNSHHGTKNRELCSECQDLVEYSIKRLEKCPYDPKPKCKNCETHCYKPVYREKMKQIMKYSGMYFVKRGRIDWAIKYFL